MNWIIVCAGLVLFWSCNTASTCVLGGDILGISVFSFTGGLAIGHVTLAGLADSAKFRDVTTWRNRLLQSAAAIRLTFGILGAIAGLLHITVTKSGAMCKSASRLEQSATTAVTAIRSRAERATRPLQPLPFKRAGVAMLKAVIRVCDDVNRFGDTQSAATALFPGILEPETYPRRYVCEKVVKQIRLSISAIESVEPDVDIRADAKSAVLLNDARNTCERAKDHMRRKCDNWPLHVGSTVDGLLGNE